MVRESARCDGVLERDGRVSKVRTLRVSLPGIVT